MKRKLRGPLIAALVLALVATLGGTQLLPDQERNSAANSEGDGNLLSRLGDAAGNLVNGGSRPAKPEVVSAGLAVQEKAPAAKTWPPQKRVKELTGKRTANSKVYQLSDGRTQAEISAVPLHYKDGKGRYQPIDTTIKPTDEKGYVQGNRTNTFTSLFGDSSDELVRFEQDGRSIELGLAGAPKDVTPKVSGSTVTYPGLAGGADVVYDVSSTALKEKIVLRRAPSGPVSYTFTLDTAGLTAQQRPDGSIAFLRTDGGEPVFVMPAPFMYDDKDDKSSPHGKVWSDKVTQTVTQSGGTSTITLSADAGWLADPARVYPVVVDPTIQIRPVPTDGQDVQIYSGNPTHPYGQDQVKWPLKVGTDSGLWRSLVQFNTSSIPQNTTIDDARLELYYSQTHESWEYDVSIEARKVNAAWDEDTATWDTMKNAMAAQPSGNMVTVDDGETGKTSVTGTWPYSGNTTLTPLAINADYRYNDDATAGNTHTWVPTLTEAGNYQVEVHFTSHTDDRSDMAPYTVHYKGGSKAYPINQMIPSGKGQWKTLGVHPFDAGTTGRVVLGDLVGKSVIADAVRFTRWGVATKKRAVSSAWMSFPVRNTVQEWVNAPASNNGFMLKAVDENKLNRGGPIFEASEYAYMNDRRDYNLPRLVVTYGRPGVAVESPTTITSTGAVLTWPEYRDPSTSTTADNIVEYQVHRSVHQNFTPSAATLIAPVSSASRTYQDTTAVPTAADNTDPMARKFYYYMVAVKTQDGQVIAGPTQPAMLPKAGQITRIYRTGVTDTSLSLARPDSNVDVYDGDPYVAVGNNSSMTTGYGDTRGVVKFPNLAGVPTDAKIVGAELRMFNTYLYPGTDRDEYVDVYKLKNAFDETTATWNRRNATTLWTTPGGDYDTSWKASFNGFSNDPEWETWDVTPAVAGWLTNPASNHGFLMRQRDEVNQTARAMLLSSEGPEPLLRPTLEVTYLEQNGESTYYAASTPQTLAPNATYTLPVTVSNPTLAAWNTTDWELSYDWKRYNAAGVLEDVPDESYELRTALPKNVAAGGTVDVTAQVKTPPSSTEGNKRAAYVLSWDLRNKIDGRKLSATSPIKGLPQNIAVEEPTSDQLGLEKFYSYAGKNTGAGGTLMNNLYAGNTVWSYNAFANPSRGLSTFVRLAYNSLDTSDTVAGYGWSLQASSMMRLGTPLDFHPNPNPTKVTLTDGDGTSHRFTWDPAANEWKSPKGVHLYLQKVTSLDCKPNTQEPKAWVLTRPDRTQFFYDCEGFLTSVVDNNGNELRFVYEERKSNNKPTKFLRYLTDATGRETLKIEYYAKGQTYDYIDDTTWTKVRASSGLTNPKIIDHVSQITDISGRKLTFTYTDKGLLGELIDGAGSTNGEPKKLQFRYDMTQGNKNVKLVKVTDPRDNATDLTYHYPQAGDDPKWHWRTKTYTDRLGHPTQFAYVDPDATNTIRTTVTDAENHATAYLMDGYGRPIETTNAKNETTKLGWDDDHNVTRLEEASGAVSTWQYDQKTGYPTEIKDATAVANGTSGTVLGYQRQLNGYVAELTEKTSPEGRKHTFGYEPDGDLAWVVDPVGNTTADANDYKTSYTYDAWGQLLTATDANGNTTVNSDFDANGYPKVITDPDTKSTRYSYDDRGQVKTVTDAYGKVTSQEYDTFGRPQEKKVPKDQDAGDFIVTPAPKYDVNDNVLESYAPNGAVSKAFFDEADQLSYTLSSVDEPGDPERRTSFTYDKVGNLLTTTEPKGNLTPTAGDYTTTNVYDEIYQLTSVTNARGDKITYEYRHGDVVKMVDPRKNATPDTSDYTTSYEYDLAHRLTRTTDALGKFTTTRYDRDGLVTATTDQVGVTTDFTLDARGATAEVRVPHKDVAGVVTYRSTRYEYDQVGNQTRMVSPRGVDTTDDPDDFATVTVYDKLNRVKETRTAYDKDDARYKTPDVTTYEYDDVGRLEIVSAPPSSGESVRNNTTYTYFDNGWMKSSSDPWDIVTSYDYDSLGSQTLRKVTSAGGSSNRTMTWSYFPDGKLRARADDGVPVGQQVVLVDNSDFNNTTATGTWNTATSPKGMYGPSYASRPAGTGTNTFTWQLNVPQAGAYEVFVRYPEVTGAATDAKYTVSHVGGSTGRTVDQSVNSGGWVSLGSYSFSEGNSHKVLLSDQATGTVAADAVKLVRNNAGETDTEKHDYTYRYDANGNQITVSDNSAGARVDSYSITYTDLNQVDAVTESKSGAVRNTTRFDYNENGSPVTVEHDRQYATYTYDPRDLVATVTNGASASDPGRKTTTIEYTDRGERKTQTKGNGNITTYSYYLDGLPRAQVEKKADGTTVSDDVITYDLNGNRSRVTSSKMNADNHSGYLSTQYDYTYDPRDRLVAVTKTGAGAGSEAYVHDANSNIISQTVKGTTTTFNYDRNRLLTSTTAGLTSSYNYDPFGRLDTVTAAGSIVKRNVYDGFDHVVETRTSTSTTKFSFDPFDRTTTRTTDAGTAQQKTTTFNYLGLSTDVLDEEVAGEVTKSYQYSPWGERLSQIVHGAGGSRERTYYGYNIRSDVDQITDEAGNTKATYGYTAFGSNDDALFTGVDKPDPANPTKEAYNSYRFNAKRVSDASGTYDMGFRNYDPGLNRFLTRDSYNGALSDMRMGTDPWNANRYAFAGGNPVSRVERDGHSSCGWNPTTWGDCAGDAWNWTTDTAGDAWDATTEAVSDAWDATTDFVSDAWDATTEAVSDAWDATTDFVSDAWDATTEAVADAWNATTEAVSDAWDWTVEHTPNAIERAWHVARFALNLPSTAVGYGYAWIAGATCSWYRGLMLTCTDAKRFARDGGITIGNVYTTTAARSQLDADPELMEHESRHSTQYFGLTGNPVNFGLAYGSASLLSGAIYLFAGERVDSHGDKCDDPWTCYNVFEMDADLHKGNYYN
ncbi:golvesin C-terminal-like domain-containing protein [Micromonospora sp. LZ34]